MKTRFPAKNGKSVSKFAFDVLYALAQNFISDERKCSAARKVSTSAKQRYSPNLTIIVRLDDYRALNARATIIVDNRTIIFYRFLRN